MQGLCSRKAARTVTPSAFGRFISKKHQIRARSALRLTHRGDEFQRFLPVGHHKQGVFNVVGGQRFSYKHYVPDIVLCQQDMSSYGLCSCRWKAEVERRTLTWFALGPHLAPISLYDTLADRKAQPRTGNIRAVQTLKKSKYLDRVFRFEPYSVIAHGDDPLLR